ncbi:DNA primase [Pseudomonas duriflava]|uniref:DNA primase n=1 Tax=Pseudomonas duriflava TaxID=459528 RepID=A0A562QJ46_9PSED|nr:DNA primase [Pseudomonas duriflava]TWI56798.1 DNA primase [Pseudomonas duriflava]
MAGLIPQGFIDDLLNRTDIVEVVGSRIKLKKTGKNYSALCPFHNEKSPSFSVSPDKQFYYCFGCGAGGNALGFVMDHDNLDFPEAVDELAKRIGLDVPREESSGTRQSRQAFDSPLYALLTAASDYYRTALKSHPQRKAAVDYLKNRGLTGEIARDYGLGFAPPGWDNLLKHLGGDSLQQKAMIDAGLLIENADSGKRYDRFRDRVIFPIRDSRGRVIAFGGRVLGDDKPKYLNSPETPVFHKGQELYGLFEARKANRDLDEIIVVEGYMDVIALAQQGIRNAVATLGTATSEEHIKRLFRLVPHILFCFDGDQAGRSAAWRALESALPSLQDGRKVRFLFLPEGEDPDTLVRKEGPDAFQARFIQQALPLAEYFFQQLSGEADPSTLEGKAHLATLATPLIDRIPGNNLRALMRLRLSELTGLTNESLNQFTQPATPIGAASEPYGYEPEPYYDSGYDSSTPARQQPYRSGQKPYSSTKGFRGKKPFGAKGDPSFRAPWVPAAVEPPTLSALRSLIHRPALALQVQDAKDIAEENDQYAQLLVALIDALQKKPEQTTLQLLARWHGTEQGKLLRVLAEKEWLISGDNLEQQFFDTIIRLAASQRERSLEQLLRKARESELSAEEKDRLRELLSRPAAPVT